MGEKGILLFTSPGLHPEGRLWLKGRPDAIGVWVFSSDAEYSWRLHACTSPVTHADPYRFA